MKIATIKILLFFFLLLYSFIADAQNNTIDSLQKVLQTQKEDTNKINTLILLVQKYADANDITNFNYYTNKVQELSEKTKFLKGKGYGYIYTVRQNLIDGKNKEALQNSLMALKIFQETRNISDIGLGNFMVAQSNIILENFPEALRYSYKALSSYEKSSSKSQIAYSNEIIGYCYYCQSNYKEALPYYLKASKGFQETADEVALANCYTYIANMYNFQNDYPNALKFDSAALKITDKSANQYSLSLIYSSISIVFQRQAENLFLEKSNSVGINNALLEAEKNNIKALKFLIAVGDSGGTGDTYMRLGSINTLLHKFPVADQYLSKALSYAKALNYNDNLKTTYLNYMRLDSAQGNFKKAFEHYKLYIVYRDSLFNAENTKATMQSKMQYEFDKKEAVTKAEQERKDAETKRIKNKQYFIIGGLGIIVLAVLLIASIQWRNNKHKQKANVLLQQQKEKVESTLIELKSTQAQLIQSEKMASLGELTAGIAHEIQNPLNFVNNFSEVNKELLAEMNAEIEKGNYNEVKEIAKDVTDNEEKINHHGKRADAIVKGMLQHSRSSTGQKESTDINALTDEYLRLSYHGLRAKDKSFNATMKTDFDLTIGKINIIPQDIGRVVLNLINNAFYAVDEKKKSGVQNYEPTVSVSTKKINGKVEIRVADNGNGVPQKVLDKIFQPFFTTKPTGQGTGLGLSLSYDIVKAHGGEIKVDTKESEGSEFIIQLPV